MEDWTEEQLREAVDKKHGKEKNKATTTDKICNEFIKAVETKKLVINLFNIFMIFEYFRYGWFWECPKGPNCKYRHILPEGFVLESEKKALKAAEKKNQISFCFSSTFMDEITHCVILAKVPIGPPTPSLQAAKWRSWRPHLSKCRACKRVFSF